MNKESEQGTDGASIKPVSSLRSHFERLKTQQPNEEGGNPSGLRLTLSPVDQSPSIPTTRASFDLPRPRSPWAGPEYLSVGTPVTPVAGGQSDDTSSRSRHRRPLSAVVHSPILTPSVNVESPRSPPRALFKRSGSNSPERIDTTPFGKVRDLISQHSSRPNSRPTTPIPETKDPLIELKPAAGLGMLAQASNSQEVVKPPVKPPPINRADKPKIPAKPASIASQNASTLAPDERKPSFEARVSPFSTPPSSEGSPSPTPTPDLSSTAATATSIQRLQEVRQASDPFGSPPLDQVSSQSKDPRMMGFVRRTLPSERKDPRSLGFGIAPEAHSASREILPPTRSNTVIEKSQANDARSLGFSNPDPVRQASAEKQRQLPQPAPRVVPQAVSQPIVRDARLLGFSTKSTSPDNAGEDYPPGLPPRRAPEVPPPRPSNETKNHATKPDKPGTLASTPDRSSKPNTNPGITRAATMNANPRYPPPPKRVDTEIVSNQPQSLNSSARSKPHLAERPRPPASNGYDSDEAEEIIGSAVTAKNEYPDLTQANRRPPFYRAGVREIPLKSDARVFDVCGRYLCTAGYVTRVFDMITGEAVMGINHGETVKSTAVAFKPGNQLDQESQRLWLGNSIGELHEIDIDTHTTISSSSAHGRAIVRILRCGRDLWTLDEDGKFFVWPADETGVPNLRYSHITHKVQKGHSCSLAVKDTLWLATGKDIRVYRPGNELSFAPLTKSLSQSGTGDVTSGTYSDESGGRVYFGHNDGKVTIYSTRDYSCLGIVKVSDYKINSLAYVGDRLWAAYKTGKIYVYDTSSSPWKVRKDWRAHDGPAAGIFLDPSSIWNLQRLQVTSLGHDNVARFWDGMLEDDWIESSMQERDVEYCKFREIKAAVITWNVGASTPYDLRSNDFIADAIHSDDPPEILVFGFQEVVNLEDRAVTAKSILGFGKKKDPTTNEQHQSGVYREWRDYLGKVVNRYTSAKFSYTEVQTSSLVGLFQCIFVRQEEYSNIRNVSAIEVKCGMKGRYGNKGALVTRFLLEDSSLCFINCHLAAGQSQTSHRHNDLATILESESLPAERDPDERASVYIGGGDGTQILDHEICILNGDLNYRIDAIPRDTVINMIKRNELNKLLERDQIMVSRRRVTGFRLSSFNELPITFAPTYKYDVDSDTYDTSEKKRAPAWCDRVMYRGPGRVKQIEYRRHEVKVSDHRPVSGFFKIRVKSINVKSRDKVKEHCFSQFAEVKKSLAEKASISYLISNLGISEKEARKLITEG